MSARRLRLTPVNIRQARAFVEREHSHLHAPLSGLCAVGVSDGDRLACVAILSRPVSRVLQAQGCAEITRVASDGTPHASSMAIGAISRAGIALGYRRLVSSILLGEAGTSYRAAGWWPVAACLKERHWDVGARNYEFRPAEQPGAKVRWEFGPDALPRDPAIDAIVRESVGKIDLKHRGESMPLFSARRVG